MTPRNPPPKTRSHLKSSPEREARKYYAPGGFGDKEISIQAGDIVLIPDAYFHKVWNTSEIEDLIFVCIFDGKRNH